MWNKITRCLHVFVTDEALLRDEHWPVIYDALSHKNWWCLSLYARGEIILLLLNVFYFFNIFFKLTHHWIFHSYSITVRLAKVHIKKQNNNTSICFAGVQLSTQNIYHVLHTCLSKHLQNRFYYHVMKNHLTFASGSQKSRSLSETSRFATL